LFGSLVNKTPIVGTLITFQRAFGEIKPQKRKKFPKWKEGKFNLEWKGFGKRGLNQPFPTRPSLMVGKRKGNLPNGPT